jgi:3-isopropylmalate/(R)-2-methylmalate dehydratase small subunit
VCLQIAGIEAVVAESYARIFYRNAVDGGFFVPFEAMDRMSQEIATGDELEIDVSRGILKNLTHGKQYRLKPLGDIIEILKAGDVFEYARKKGLIKQ